MNLRAYCIRAGLFTFFPLLALPLPAADSPAPLKVLLLVSGGYHDYKTLVPFISSNLSRRINVTIDQKWGLDLLKQADFAEKYDAVIYDVCDDEAPDEAIENALRATREGKPTVMIHCAVHAFRRSPRIAE